MKLEPEHQLATRIIGRLNEGLAGLDADTSERLAAARRQALSRYRPQPEPVWGLAWARPGGRQAGGPRLHGALQLAAIGALVIVLVGIAYWQSQAPGNGNGELAELDVGLLTGDLPINAYLDKGFDSWLKRSSR